MTAELSRIAAASCIALLLAAPSVLAEDQQSEGSVAKPMSEPTQTSTNSSDDTEGYSETMVVTASRVEEPILESPVAISVIDSTDLATAASENYVDLLRGVPGLNAIQLTARDTQFSARTAAGVMGPRLLTLVDGRSVYLDHQGIVMLDGLSFGTDEIEQIEVLKGPGSTMWGANALAGVINIRTKAPSSILGGLFEIEGGENGYGRLGARWAGQLPNDLTYKVSASYLEQDAWERDPLTPAGLPIPPEFRYQNEGTSQPKLDARVDHASTASTTWSYRAGYAGVDGMILSGLGPLSLRDDFYHAYGEVRRSDTHSDLTIYWNRMQGDTLNLLSGDVLVSKTDTYVAEYSGRVPEKGRHRLVYGVNARHNEFDLTWAQAADSRDEFGAFAEDEIDLGKLFKASMGARIDHFDTIGTTFSPRLTLFATPRWNHVLRLTYNRAYRAPTAIENHMNVLTTNPVSLAPGLPLFPLLVRGLGSKELKEESIDSVELGYSAILGGRHELSMAIYRNEIHDSIEFATTEVYGPADPPPGWPFPPAFTPPFPKTFSPFNADEVREQGAEFSLRTTWTPTWRSTITYTYQDEPEVRVGSDPFPVVVNSPPEHLASATLSALGSIWSGSVGISFTDEAFWRDVLDERFWGPTDSYTLVQGNITRDLTQKISLTLRGTNLFDKTAKQHVYGDLIGRQVTLRLSMRY